jgi:large subunit ribosomal protein L10
MPPRLQLRSLSQLAELQLYAKPHTCGRCSYATTVATIPAPSDAQIHSSRPPLKRYPSSQPPSHRDPKYRKSQRIRSYVSLLQTTPLIILFQHNSLRAAEWTGIRRELTSALRKLDAQLLSQGASQEDLIGEYIKLQVIKTTMFEPALRITEYYRPEQQSQHEKLLGIDSEAADPSLTHSLSESAYQAIQEHKGVHPLTPLLTGSLAILTFPTVSPQHIKTAFSILAPQAPQFPAPPRRLNPSLYELPVQEGLKKLMLLGARIDGQVFDKEGTRWVGSIDGGMDGLRAQLVGMLQGFGAGLTQTLESAGRSIWFTMESRRNMLEEEQQGKTEEGDQPAKKE